MEMRITMRRAFKFMLAIIILLLFPLTQFLNIDDLLLVSILFSFTTFGLPIIVYILHYKLNIFETLNLHKISARHIIFTIICTILFLPLNTFISTLAELVFPNNVEAYLDTIINLIELPFWKALIILALLPAIFEELVMRGVLLSSFKGYSIHLAAFINGLFFAIIHFDFQQGSYTFLFGVLLTYLVYYTGSILSAVISHFIFNATTVCSLYYLKYTGQLESLTNTTEETLTFSNFTYFAIYVVIISALAYFIFKKQIINKSNILYEKTTQDVKSIFNIYFFACICFYILIMLLLHSYYLLQ